MLAANPLAGAAGLTLLAAMFLFVLGLFRISVAVVLPLPARGWMLIAGLIEILLAVLITVRWPATALWVIGLYLGIEMLVGGGALLAIALGLRHHFGLVADAEQERYRPPAA